MMEHWIQTVVEQHHFPFYEFICLMFLGMQWSIIVRLKKLLDICSVCDKKCENCDG